LKRKTDVELQRQRISLLLRAQASIVRAEFLNEVLPAALEAFDARLQNGEAIEVREVNIAGLIEQAVADVSA
jgi:hypothetical protein